ncbi:MFS transporter [Sphingomonas panacis]|uniref:MFS transporter n=1 Tax=Sphingomonas panacis TaxID=1560345 RepID=A0A1B3ZCM9_9SPHN|nr:MFS transporter [Sphingomonas panacis]AOH85184.1 MFS transporter [Sphingomonas panacis]
MTSQVLGGHPYSQPRETPRGWLVVLAAMVGVAVGLSPVPFYTIGMFAPELSKAFGWSFAAMMGSIGVQSAVVMVSGPLAGFAVDRWGPRRVAIVSLLLFGLCFMSLALSNGSLLLYYAQWGVMSVLGAGTLSAAWTRVVNGWFDKNRGLALGFASTGTGLTGFLIKPFTAWIITDYGWRAAFVAVGLLPILIGVPIILLLFHERRGLAATVGSNEAAEVEEYGLTLMQALRSRRFWILAAAFFLIAFALTAPTPNLENILKSFHFELAQIGRITASFGLAVIAGRIVGGWMLDRIWAPACAFVILLVPALGSWLLAGDTLSGQAALAAVLCIGFGAGFEFDLLAYLISRYFGQRNYGMIYGCFYTVIAFGGGLGPVVYGYAFDSTGTYGTALLIGVACVLTGSVLLLLLGAYPVFTAADAANPQQS